MNQMYNIETPMMPWRMVPVPMANMPNMPCQLCLSLTVTCL